MNKPQKILMLCLGNICRSPTAQGVLEKLVRQAGLQDKIKVDSAGILDYHSGNLPDSRAQQHALQRGYDLSSQQARQIQSKDFQNFDWILVMDASNKREVTAMCPPQHQHKIRCLAEFCTTCSVKEIPDPYYGGYEGFELVLDLCEDACENFLVWIKKQIIR